MSEVNEESRVQITLTKLVISLLYTMFLTSGSASGFMVKLDGWASTGVVYGSPEIVICCKSVSGSEGTELYALDPRTKSVAWRKEGAWSISDAVLDSQGNYVSIEDPSNLAARHLKTGSVVWDANLAVIKPSETAWRKESLYLRDLGVGRFNYKGPFITSEGVWVFRVGMPSGDYGGPLFEDWMIFDSRNGRLLKHGPGEYIAHANDSFLVKVPFSPNLSKGRGNQGVFQEKILVVLKGDGKAVPSTVPQGILDVTECDRMDTFYFQPSDVQFSWAGRGLFYANRWKGEKVGIFAGSSDQFTFVASDERPKHQIEWVLLTKYILRYAETVRHGDGTKKVNLWIQVYDIEGKKLKEETVVNRGVWLIFLGVTATGDVLFSADDQLVIFQIPSLRKVAKHDLATITSEEGVLSYKQFFAARSSDILYETVGNTSFYDQTPMPTNEMPHQLGVKMIDYMTGKTIWHYSEKVVIQKVTDK